MTDSKNTTDTGETLPGVDVSDWPETLAFIRTLTASA